MPYRELWWWQSCHAECLGGSVDEQSEVGVVFRDFQQVVRGESVAEEVGEDFGVAGAYGHAERGAAVAEDSGQCLRIELIQHLGAENVTRPVLPGFGQCIGHRGIAISEVRVELVNDDHTISAILFGDVSPTHRGHL